MRSNDDIELMIEKFGDTVWRVCVLYFRQNTDAQDAFQETILKYALSSTVFNGDEHLKAWLIRVATNTCKDMLKAAERKNISLDSDQQSPSPQAALAQDDQNQGLQDVLDAIQGLDDPPRTPVYLALYEGYSAKEIAALLDAPVNTVYSWISRGRQQLKEVLR